MGNSRNILLIVCSFVLLLSLVVFSFEPAEAEKSSESQKVVKDKSISKGKYVNNELGFSIKPHSFNNINDLDEQFYLRNIVFTSTKSDYNVFPSYFTITKTNEASFATPPNSLFKEEFIKIYSDGLKGNSVISDVQITDSSFSETSDGYTIKFSGEITNLLGSKTIQTKFSMIVLLSDSGTYSFTLNSSPEDYEQSLQEFKKSYDSFKISPDSKVKDKQEKAKNDKAQNDKAKNDKAKKGKGN